MQLGTRWSVGDELPTRLPEVVELAVRQVEDDLSKLDLDTATWRWTLTWLDGRPVIELDDGTRITYTPEKDEARIEPPTDDSDESWDQDFDDDDDE
ncbi:hypothetical protein [Homoserinimonas sp. OAct 916]|uniref:hypothetical protein n=1 Tax=Homoserinimonas sp. OAct 916 TaxID=2211450 RepID=UPI001E4CF1DF|nr:hypothetical protein [Homoserinimonas sp. OAct 916]